MNPWLERALRVTPGGAQTRSKKDLFPDPVTVEGGNGAYVWTPDGRRMTDWISGLCAVGLGHAHPKVTEAVVAAVKAGVCMPLPTRAEVGTAELLMEIIGYGEMVRWVKTGSEATAGAMLIARRATGRRMVASIGYHGWHPGHLKGAGIYDIPYGDLHKLESTLQACYVAAVMLESHRDGPPPAGYVEGVQALCRKHNTLFIMDEIVTGFRWATGGVTEMLGLEPDICCFSKAMANGHPQAAIVGKREVMEYAEGVSSTFGGTLDGLAAVRAVCEVYREEGVVERLWDTGRALTGSMAAAGRPMIGYPVHPRFKSEDAVGGDTWSTVPADVRELSHKLAAAGHLAHPSGFNPTYAHTDADVRAVVEAAQ